MNKVIQGDCLIKLKELEDNSVDSIVTDPPYELGFMGKSWDNTGIANNVEMWKECLRVLKPGGHLLAFSGTRTYHRMASAIENAGFEVRNQLIWAFGSGFPKSKRINASPKFCQCVLTGRSGGNTNLSQQQGDHNNKELDGHDDDLALSGVDHLKNEDVGSQGDYQQDCGSSDGQPQDILSHDQELAPLQEYAQEHSHSSLPDDVQVSESLHIPSSVQHNDHLSNQDCSHHDFSANAKLKSIRESNKPSEVLKSLSDKQDKVSYKKVNELQIKYINGFPVCQVCGKPNADGWGTQLKPAFEPICMAMKPLSEKGFSENCLKWGTGGINVDESRVEYSETNKPIPQLAQNKREIKTDNGMYGGNSYNESKTKSTIGGSLDGRFPANLIHDNSEEVRECFPEAKGGAYPKERGKSGIGFASGKLSGDQPAHQMGDTGNASRFFKSIIYQAKASKSERNRGCEELPLQEKVWNGQSEKPSEDMKDVEKRFTTQPKQNNHPTVKPISLMEYLIKMVTPKGGIVLDPFAGSGSTLVAAKQNGYQYIGIEMTEEYIPIIEARLEAVKERQQKLL